MAGLADPFLASLVQTCIALAAVIGYTLVIDKIGRRYPICVCFSVLTLTLWVIGGLYYAQATAVHNALVGSDESSLGRFTDQIRVAGLDLYLAVMLHRCRQLILPDRLGITHRAAA